MTQITRVYESDSYDVMAKKIYSNFDVGQSCSILGFLLEKEDPVPKGLRVLEELERLDNFNNMARARDGKWRRRRVKPEDSIGDFTAQKQWRFKKSIVNGSKIKYDIWRTQ